MTRRTGPCCQSLTWKEFHPTNWFLPICQAPTAPIQSSRISTSTWVASRTVEQLKSRSTTAIKTLSVLRAMESRQTARASLTPSITREAIQFLSCRRGRKLSRIVGLSLITMEEFTRTIRSQNLKWAIARTSAPRQTAKELMLIRLIASFRTASRSSTSRLALNLLFSSTCLNRPRQTKTWLPRELMLKFKMWKARL